MSRRGLLVVLVAGALAFAAKPEADSGGAADECAAHSAVDEFSIDDAVYRLDQIDDALASFMTLTDLASPHFSSHEFEAIGNTDWETQNLGFHNWSYAIRGALYYADYRIAELELSIIQARYEDGDASLSELTAAEDYYTVAYTMFIDFMQSSVLFD